MLDRLSGDDEEVVKRRGDGDGDGDDDGDADAEAEAAGVGDCVRGGGDVADTGLVVVAGDNDGDDNDEDKVEGCCWGGGGGGKIGMVFASGDLPSRSDDLVVAGDGDDDFAVTAVERVGVCCFC